jgi:hypothetical protein
MQEKTTSLLTYEHGLKAQELIVLFRVTNILFCDESDKPKSSLSVCKKSLADTKNDPDPTVKNIRPLEVTILSMIAKKTLLSVILLMLEEG